MRMRNNPRKGLLTYFKIQPLLHLVTSTGRLNLMSSNQPQSTTTTHAFCDFLIVRKVEEKSEILDDFLNGVKIDKIS